MQSKVEKGKHNVGIKIGEINSILKLVMKGSLNPFQFFITNLPYPIYSTSTKISVEKGHRNLKIYICYNKSFC